VSRYRNIAIATTFGVENVAFYVWLRGDEKTEDMFTRSDRIRKRDRQMDGRIDRQTDTVQRHRPHLCIALHGNNVEMLPLKGAGSFPHPIRGVNTPTFAQHPRL